MSQTYRAHTSAGRPSGGTAVADAYFTRASASFACLNFGSIADAVTYA